MYFLVSVASSDGRRAGETSLKKKLERLGERGDGSDSDA